MRIIKCDRCGATLDKGLKPWAFAICDSNTGEPYPASPFKDWDFCLECKDEIIEFVKVKPKIAEAPKAKSSSLPKGIDNGKVVALRNAHWSVVKIAEEMGCSEQRIGQILKEMKEYIK